MDLPPSRPSAFPAIVAESLAMRRAVEHARRFAPLDIPVLLVGATGTGKEVLAQAIHQWSGRTGALVDVDCGALPPGMITSELFGHRRGSFTSAVDSVPGLIEGANGGTLFLDELASLPAEGQRGLLRVLETGEMRRVGEQTKRRLSLRLVAAVQETDGGRGPERTLREDLYQRLAGGVIYLPPLRERPEDLGVLAVRFAHGRGIEEAALKLLERHDWPGNVRELRNVMARATLLQERDPLSVATLAEAIDVGRLTGGRPDMPAPDAMAPLARARQALEILCLQHGGQADRISEDLGISPSTLYRRLRVLGIRLKGFSGRARKLRILNGGENSLRIIENFHRPATDETGNLLSLLSDRADEARARRL
ncbi:MAG: sigma 54-interacting transcriptional regulator [Gemmatimonadota bacterium]